MCIDEIALSVIIPTSNEMKLEILPQIIKNFTFCNAVEIIVVDSHSSDGTVEFLENMGVKLFRVDTFSRAQRLNVGIDAARGEMILLHHPRSIIDPQGINYLIKNVKNLRWGGFIHKFDTDHSLLKFTSWYSNNIRFIRNKIVYLDHCVFARRDLLKRVGPIPPVDIFEDTILSKMLNKVSAPIMLPYCVTTSAIRFVRNGIIYQSLINQLLKLGYCLGISHRLMNKIYERTTKLNSKY